MLLNWKMIKREEKLEKGKNPFPSGVYMKFVLCVRLTILYFVENL